MYELLSKISSWNNLLMNFWRNPRKILKYLMNENSEAHEVKSLNYSWRKNFKISQKETLKESLENPSRIKIFWMNLNRYPEGISRGLGESIPRQVSKKLMAPGKIPEECRNS